MLCGHRLFVGLTTLLLSPSIICVCWLPKHTGGNRPIRVMMKQDIKEGERPLLLHHLGRELDGGLNAVEVVVQVLNPTGRDCSVGVINLYLFQNGRGTSKEVSARSSTSSITRFLLCRNHEDSMRFQSPL